MRVADLMETHVEAAHVRMPAEEAWRRMLDRGLVLFVVTSGPDVLGVVTREQLGGEHGSANRQERTLGAFIPAGQVTLTPDCTAQRAADLLDGSAAGCVPVLERGHLVGVVTTAGLLRRMRAHAGSAPARRVSPRRRAPAGAVAAPSDAAIE